MLRGRGEEGVGPRIRGDMGGRWWKEFFMEVRVSGEGEFRQWWDVIGLGWLSEDVQDTSPRPEIVRLFQEIAILDSI